MEARRRSDGHNEPQMQVVGFHVEGQSPSPSPTSLLQDSLRTISSGSPTPVIIPPQFQRESSVNRTTDSAAHRSLGPELSASSQAGQTPHNVIRTTSQTGNAAGSESTTTAAAADRPPAAAPDQVAAQQRAAAALAAAAAAAATNSSTSTGESKSRLSATSAAAAVGQPEQQQQQQLDSRPDGAAPPPSAAAGGPAAAAAAAATPAVDGKEGRKKPALPPGEKPPPKVPKPASKAERRALQEAQRAAKAAAKGASDAGASISKGTGAAAADGAAAAGSSGKPPKGPSATGSGATSGQGSSSSDAAAVAGSKGAASGGAAPTAAGKISPAAGGSGHKARGPLNSNSTELFAHLQQYRPVSVEGVLRKEGGSVHSAVLALGLRYADGSIKGSTARCVAMVHALSQVIADYHTPEGKSLTRDLMGTINASVDFLVRCRPLSVSMGNAIKALKLYLSKIDPAAPEDAAKSLLLSQMQDWLNEKVALADKVLVEHAVTKVYDGDVILTYAYSQIVLEVLLSAAHQGRRFRVLVLDSRPELEGRQMMRRLLQADIPCSYAFLSGLSYCMREVTKVMLGAAAVLSNGTVLSRAGSAAVAMSAAASSKPVLVCCEAFKFHERVQLDSITHNELGDPDVLAHLPPHAAAPGTPTDPNKGAESQCLTQWKDIPRLALLNLKYDAMPSEYVTMVVTEFGMIPPSSVPVILREFSESAQME